MMQTCGGGVSSCGIPLMPVDAVVYQVVGFGGGAGRRPPLGSSQAERGVVSER